MDKNNVLLHSLAAAAMALILVYAGEQWRGNVKNDYILATMWISGCGVSLFVMSMIVGFFNESSQKKVNSHRNTANQCYLYEGQPVNTLELDVPRANDMNAHSELAGYYSCWSKITHIIERSLTFTGAAALAISPILFVLGVTK